jgi:hypothetical protein
MSCDVAHSAAFPQGLTIVCVELESHFVKALRGSRILLASSAMLALLVFLLPQLNPVVSAQIPNSSSPHTTVVVFSDHPMLQAQWTALFSALQSNLAKGGEEAQVLDGAAQFIRGDAVEPGLKVDSAIVVFLHGNCELEPLVRRTAFGVALGWVYRHQGQIEPFAHVDCTRIGQVLGPQALGVKSDKRTTMMADAMARVILHEWIHIASQCPAHAEQGIEKAQFGAADLLFGESHPVLSVRNR